MGHECMDCLPRDGSEELAVAYDGDGGQDDEDNERVDFGSNPVNKIKYGTGCCYGCGHIWRFSTESYTQSDDFC